MSIIRKHDMFLKAENGIELVPLLDEHLPLLYKWNNDPEVVYWSDSGNFDVCSEEDVKGIYGIVSQNAYCFLMIYNGEPIGDCWLQKMNLTDIIEKHPGKKVYRIDMTIGEKACWGKGLGSAALSALMKFAFTEEQVDILYLISCDYNERSGRTALKNGFTECGKTHVYDSDRAKFEYLYLMDRDTYLTKTSNPNF